MDGNYIKMKIYIPQNKLSLIKESINEEVTFFEFYRDIKKFTKDLLSNPFHANTSGVLQKKGISKDELKSILLDRDIIKKKERIDEPYDDKLGKKKSMFHVIYTVPKRNFESNIKSLYKYYFG